MLTFRYAAAEDADLYFRWVNDALVRQNSLNTKQVSRMDHVAWFSSRVEDPNVFMYVFLDQQNTPIGQVIIQRKDNWASVGQSIANEHRGKGYSSEMLSKATDDFLEKFPEDTIVSVVKANNIASIKMSINSRFNVVKSTTNSDKILVLKGYHQNDEDFILQFKSYFKIL